MDQTVFEAGIRFNPYVHVAFQLDTESGDMSVTVEFKDNDGNLHYITGTVAWDE